MSTVLGALVAFTGNGKQWAPLERSAGLGDGTPGQPSPNFGATVMSPNLAGKNPDH